jgi:hypothetical protein
MPSSYEGEDDLLSMMYWTPEKLVAKLKGTVVAGVPKRTEELILAHRIDGTRLIELSDAAWGELGVHSQLTIDQFRSFLRRAAHAGAARWTHRVPLLNLGLDFLHQGRPPTNENLQNLLNTIGVVSTLFLGTVIALPGGSVGIEEIEDALERFQRPPYDEFPEYGPHVIVDLMDSTAASIYCLGTSLLTTLVLLFSLFITPETMSPELHVRRNWWRYARWCSAWSVLSLIVGIFFASIAINRAVAIAWPDVYIPTGRLSLLDTFRVWSYALDLAAVGGVLLILSAAKAHSNYAMEDINSAYMKELHGILQRVEFHFERDSGISRAELAAPVRAGGFSA